MRPNQSLFKNALHFNVFHLLRKIKIKFAEINAVNCNEAIEYSKRDKKLLFEQWTQSSLKQTGSLFDNFKWIVSVAVWINNSPKWCMFFSKRIRHENSFSALRVHVHIRTQLNFQEAAQQPIRDHEHANEFWSKMFRSNRLRILPCDGINRASE